MNINILYEDEYCVVIDKPAGLIVHADGKTKEPNVTDWFEEKYPASKGVGEPMRKLDGSIIERSGIVHRLDRETSGVLLIAKTNDSFEFFKQQFQDRSIQKTYNAFVYGEMKQKEGTIDRPIARSRKDFRLWSAQPGSRGEARDAHTDFHVLLTSGGASYVEVYPRTGRTHQIRVHFKAINHPIVSDSLYAPNRESLFGFERLALHARLLEFKTPDGLEHRVEASFPMDFIGALETMRALAKA